MQSYTSKPAQPVTVQAVQYEAPDAEGNGGNADELVGGIDGLRKQDPWNPAAGQNCLVLTIDGPGDRYSDVVTGGDFIVTGTHGELSVLDPDEFAETYTAVTAPAESTETPALDTRTPAQVKADERAAAAAVVGNTNQNPEA